MSASTKALVAGLTALAILCGMAVLLAHDYHLTKRAAMKGGYIQVQDVGSQGYHWEKAKTQ